MNDLEYIGLKHIGNEELHCYILEWYDWRGNYCIHECNKTLLASTSRLTIDDIDIVDYVNLNPNHYGQTALGYTGVVDVRTWEQDDDGELEADEWGRGYWLDNILYIDMWEWVDEIEDENNSDWWIDYLSTIMPTGDSPINELTCLDSDGRGFSNVNFTLRF